MTTDRAILLVEDSKDDIFFMQRALKRAEVNNPLYVVEDGQKAIDYLSGAGSFRDREKHPLPVLVFLDLKLPFCSGHEVLKWIRERKELDSIVVVVLTSSDEPSDVSKCYELGANSYVVKPPTAEKLLDLAKAFRWYWLEFNRFQMASQ